MLIMEFPANASSSQGLGIIVMGPSGCGKSEVGQALANYYKCKFLDGDSFHTQENISKMQGGTPLTDADRFDWLQILRQEIKKEFYLANNTSTNEAENGAANVKVIAGCSALRKLYRDILREQNFKIIFVFLDCSQELLEKRMRERIGHFMKVDMLVSQLKTLERPGAEEPTVILKLGTNKDMDVMINSIDLKLKQMLGQPMKVEILKK